MRIRVFGQYVHVSIAALAAVEAALLFSAFMVACVIRFDLDLAKVERDLTTAFWPRALLFSVVLIVSLLSFGLYSSRQRAQFGGMAVRILVAVAAGVACLSVILYLLPHHQWIGRGALAIATISSLVALGVSRIAFHQLVDETRFKRRVIVYGCGKNAAPISRLRRRSDRRGFELVGFVQPDGELPSVSSTLLIEKRAALVELCMQHDAAEIVVAMDDRRRSFPILELLECRLAGIDVTELLTFLERETGRVRIDVLNPSWMIFGEGFRRDPLRLLSSRALDIAASSLILLLTFPLMLLTALAIKLEEGWRAPVFYAQQRVGLGGKMFNVLKFRSMRQDAERDGQARWATKHDDRVTRVGAFIRKCRIDELPQVLCVLRGHMSFVGPRPERPEFVADLAQKIPYYVQRHCVKPGITGWAQLCYPYGSSEQDALEKLQYDLYYIKNNTLLFDLGILLQTVEVVVMGQGAR
jgi:sugar transferase (PEP-CTERM system associated)